MYGLVNQAISDMVTEAHGKPVWDRIRELAGAPALPFEAMESYPDELTYGLVGAASTVLETPAEDLLVAFGHFWVLQTATRHYGHLLDLGGSTLFEFLRNLDELHSRVALTFERLRPPSFEVEQLEDGALSVHYRSHRPGLAPFVRGLLLGLAERFDTVVDVEHLESQPGAGAHEVFLVRSRSS